MKTDTTSLRQYRRTIISIVCLTNIPVILFLPTIYSQAIGWIAGTIASSANFYWLSRNVESISGREPESSKLASYKLFYLRFLFLALYAVIIVIALKPDIMIFGMGLISVQFAIFGYHFYGIIREKITKDDEDRKEI